MCKHDSLCLRRPCSFQKRWINVVLRNRHIDKYRHCSILDHRRNCCRETCRNRDHLIARKDLTLFQERGSQCHKSKQIRRRSGVYQRTVTHTEILRKCMFKFVCITSGCQPEFKRTVYQIYHFFCIVYSGRIWNAVTLLIWFLLIMIFVAVISCHFQNLFSGLLFCHFFKHNILLLYFIFLYNIEILPAGKKSCLLVYNVP